MSKPPTMTSIVAARLPNRSPEKRFAIGSQIVTAKRTRKRHYGEIVDDPADPVVSLNF
jgi:hypothetical protein